ncbi:MAG TPA: C40 family peptidase [Bacteroidales bacterium]|nr:C40 family peptidase [Bacteroidales bacterium]
MKSKNKFITYLFAAGMLCHFLLYSCAPGLISSGSRVNTPVSGKSAVSVPVVNPTGTKDIEAPEIRQKPESTEEGSSGRNDRISFLADDLLETARTYLGVPHCMGGTSFRCIDCSGFVMKVFEEYGITLPHNSQAQSKIGEVIRNRDELMKGDIVFFKESYKTSNYITHAGIYIGDNRFIHTSSGKGVTITSLDDSWWKDKFVYGTRVLE